MRIPANLALAFLLILIALLAGCASGADLTSVQRSEIILAEIRSQIAGGQPEVAVGRISGLRRDKLLSGMELDTLQSEAVDRIESDLSQALGADDFEEAIRLYRNLEVLGNRDNALSS